MANSPDTSPLQNFVKMTEIGPVPANTDELTIGAKSIKGVKAAGQITVLSSEFVGPITASGNGLLALARVATAMRKALNLANKPDFSKVSKYAISFVLGAQKDADEARGVKCAYASLSGDNTLYYRVQNNIVDKLLISLLSQATINGKFPGKNYIAKDDSVWGPMLQFVTEAGADPVPAITENNAAYLREAGVLVNQSPDSSAAASKFNDALANSAKIILPKSGAGEQEVRTGYGDDPNTLRLTKDGANKLYQTVLDSINTIRTAPMPDGFDAISQSIINEYADVIYKKLTTGLSQSKVAEDFIKIQKVQTRTPQEAQTSSNIKVSAALPPGAF